MSLRACIVTTVCLLSFSYSAWAKDIGTALAQVREINEVYIRAVSAKGEAASSDETKYRLARELDERVLHLIQCMMTEFGGNLERMTAFTSGVVEWCKWPRDISELDWIHLFKNRSRAVRVVYREARIDRRRSFFVFEISFWNDPVVGTRPSFGLRCVLAEDGRNRPVDMVPSLPLGRDDWWNIWTHPVALLGFAHKKGLDYPVILCTRGREGSGAFFRHYEYQYDAVSQAWKPSYDIGDTAGVRTWSFHEDTLTFKLEVAEPEGVVDKHIDLREFGYALLAATSVEQNTGGISPAPRSGSEGQASELPQLETQLSVGPEQCAASAEAGTGEEADRPWLLVGVVAVAFCPVAAGAWLLIRRRIRGTPT